MPPKNIYLTPSFLETQRGKGIQNTVLADFIGSNLPEVRSEVQMVRQKYGTNNEEAVRNYLDWKVYGTTQPTTRFAPEPPAPATPQQQARGIIDESRQGLGGYVTSELMPAGLQRQGPNLAERVGEDIGRRGAQLREGLQREDGAFGKARSAFTAFTGGVGDVGAEVLKTASGVLPKFIESGFSMIAQDLGAPEKAQELSTQYAAWRDRHPEAAANLEAIGNLGRAAVNTAGVEQLANVATQGAKTAAQGAREFVESPPPAVQPKPSGPSPAVQRMAQPKATREEIFRAEREGRATFNRQGEPTGILPTDRQVEIAGAMESAGVKPGMPHGDTTRAVQQGISKAGAEVERSVAQSNLAFNDNELRGVYQAARRQAADDAVIVTPPEEKVFKSVADAYVKTFNSVLKKPLADGGADGNRLLALYKTRVQMDKLAPPKTFTGDSVMNAKVNAFRYYRDATNDFIGSAMEANGLQYSESMRHMSRLFRALDALETTVPKGLSATDFQKALSLAKKGAIGLGIYAGARNLPVVGDVLP